MEWNIKVKIDYRENLIKNFFENNDEFKNIIEIKNLEIGDIIIEINDKPIIMSGRYWYSWPSKQKSAEEESNITIKKKSNSLVPIFFDSFL